MQDSAGREAQAVIQQYPAGDDAKVSRRKIYAGQRRGFGEGHCRDDGDWRSGHPSKVERYLEVNKETQSVMATLIGQTSILDEPVIADDLSKGDFDFRSMKTGGVKTVYLTLPRPGSIAMPNGCASSSSRL